MHRQCRRLPWRRESAGAATANKWSRGRARVNGVQTGWPPNWPTAARPTRLFGTREISWSESAAHHRPWLAAGCRELWQTHASQPQTWRGGTWRRRDRSWRRASLIMHRLRQRRREAASIDSEIAVRRPLNCQQRIDSRANRRDFHRIGSRAAQMTWREHYESPLQNRQAATVVPALDWGDGSKLLGPRGTARTWAKLSTMGRLDSRMLVFYIEAKSNGPRSLSFAIAPVLRQRVTNLPCPGLPNEPTRFLGTDCNR
jgi:hypothetical protein